MYYTIVSMNYLLFSLLQANKQSLCKYKSSTIVNKFSLLSFRPLTGINFIIPFFSEILVLLTLKAILRRRLTFIHMFFTIIAKNNSQPLYTSMRRCFFSFYTFYGITSPILYHKFHKMQ